MKKETREALKQAWKEVQDPSLLFEEVQQFTGRQYEIGDLVIPRVKASTNKWAVTHIFLSVKVSTSVYDEDYLNDSEFVIFNKSSRLVKKRIYDKETNYFKNVVVHVPIYDLVKLDDPCKIIYRITSKMFVLAK